MKEKRKDYKKESERTKTARAIESIFKEFVIPHVAREIGQGIKIKRPKGWRKGQTMYNFLYDIEKRQIDPFYISDKDLEQLYKQFLKECSPE